MSWLIWKEYRVNRLIIFVGLGLLLVPHAIALINGLRHPEGWQEYFDASSGASFFCTQIVLALLGGNAIAGERVDRSAEFLATLPLARWQNLLGKLVLAPLAVAAIWGVNFVTAVFVAGRFSDVRDKLITEFEHAGPGHFEEMLIFFGCVAVTGLTFFCVSWLLSSMLNSAVFSVAAGLITPLAVVMGIAGVVWWFQIEPPGREEELVPVYWYLGLCFPLSVASFVAGTVYYLRRVEP